MGGQPSVTPDAGPPAGQEAPTVLSTYPETGASGISSTLRAKIVFSSPMDRASTESALSVAGIQQVEFLWSEADTVLELLPQGGWPYAEGIFPGPEAIRFEVTLSDTASDKRGVRLSRPASWWFKSLRRLTLRMPPVPTGSGYLFRTDSDLTVSANLISGGYSIYVGGARGSNDSAVGLATFETSWPEGIREIEYATMTWNIAGEGSPSDLVSMEAVEIQKVTGQAYFLRGIPLGTESSVMTRHVTALTDVFVAALMQGKPAKVSVLFWTTSTATSANFYLNEVGAVLSVLSK